MKKRHVFFYKFLRLLAAAFVWLKFGYTCKKMKELPDNYIVLCNHVTDYDPVLLGIAFPKQMYFVASEHIVRWKRLYKFLNYAFEPIIRKKGTVAGTTAMDIMRKVKKGNRICMFAEGVRSWDGATCKILPSTARLVKKSGCALVTYKLIGGYFTSPVWSKTSRTRRGHFRGEPVNLYTKEQLDTMTEDEIYNIIISDLYEDAYERQRKETHKYRGRRLAENLEKILFICPECNSKDSFLSRKNSVYCKCCDYRFKYDVYGFLRGTRLGSIKAFSDWQNEMVSKDVSEGVAYTGKHASLVKIVGHKAIPVAEGAVSMTKETLACGEFSVAVSDILDLEIHGKDSIVFSTTNDYYELVPDASTNARKFLLYYDEYNRQNTGQRG